MSTSAKRVKEQKTDPKLVLTPKINEWLLNHGDEAYPEWVAKFVYNGMLLQPRDRTNAFSASAGATCPRSQIFGYLGLSPNQQNQPALINLFSDGKWRHLRWQAMLFSAGLLSAAEVPIELMDMKTKGSMDGVGYTGNSVTDPKYRNKKFGFELKGMWPDGWEKLKKEGEISTKHKEQMSRYFLGSDIDFFVYIVENKSTQEWLEFVIDRDVDMLADATKELNLLNHSVDMEVLPPLLSPCQEASLPAKQKVMRIRKGYDAQANSPYIFKNCPFGGAKTKSVCIKIHQMGDEWDDAVAMAKGEIK